MQPYGLRWKERGRHGAQGTRGFDSLEALAKFYTEQIGIGNTVIWVGASDLNVNRMWMVEQKYVCHFHAGMKRRRMCGKFNEEREALEYIARLQELNPSDYVVNEGCMI